MKFKLDFTVEIESRYSFYEMDYSHKARDVILAYVVICMWILKLILWGNVGDWILGLHIR